MSTTKVSALSEKTNTIGGEELLITTEEVKNDKSKARRVPNNPS